MSDFQFSEYQINRISSFLCIHSSAHPNLGQLKSDYVYGLLLVQFGVGNRRRDSSYSCTITSFSLKWDDKFGLSLIFPLTLSARKILLLRIQKNSPFYLSFTVKAFLAPLITRRIKIECKRLRILPILSNFFTFVYVFGVGLY